MVSRFPSFIPGHQRLSCLYQVINILLFIPGHQCLLVYTRSSTSSCLYKVIQRFLVHTREASYSHQWLGCGERFLGWYNADEWFLGRLHEWRLGESDPRLWEGSGRRVDSSRPVSGMSTTMGGRSAWLMAAASGGAASISSCISGQAARGWGSTRPGLKPPAILTSLCGSVNDFFPLKSQRVIQRRSLDEIAEEQVRRGQIRRSLDKIVWCNPAGCLAGPVYIHPGIQDGPGQIGILHSDWSRIWDAVDAVGARRSGDAPLGYSSLTRCFQAGFQ